MHARLSMHFKTLLTGLLLIGLYLLTGTCLAEQSLPEWAQGMKQGASSIEKLEAAGKSFHSLLTPADTAKTRGHVLLIHGANQHPDWPQVIQPLRTALPKLGWTTLSIEMPPAGVHSDDKHYTGLLEQATAHILAAQGYLQDQDAQRIIIIANGLGARMAVDWLSKTPQSEIKALVLISMEDGEANSGIDSNQDLLKIKIPLLDIHAEHDLPRVLKAAAQRRQQFRAKRQYRALEIYTANPYYSQHDEELVKRIRGWLKHTFKQSK